MKKLLLAAFLILASGVAMAGEWATVADVWVRLDGGSIVTSGTVSSVDCSSAQATIITCGGGPITTSGTLTLSLGLQAKNLFLAGPTSGSDATPTFRAITSVDLLGASVANDDMVQSQGGVLTISSPGGTAQVADVVATEAAGTSDTWARGDHTHALGAAAVSGQTEDTAPDATADFALEYDASASGLKKVLFKNLVQEAVNDATEDTSPDVDDDFVATYDTSASAIKKVKIGRLVKQRVSFVIQSPGSAENFGGTYFTESATILKIHCVSSGSGLSSPSVTPDFRYSTDRSAAGTAVTTSPSAITASSTGSDLTLNNTAIPAAGWLWMTTTAQSGTVPQFACTVEYSEP